jgi:hypothetical protein
VPIHFLRYQSSCGLLFVCRDIRYEALPIFYAATSYTFKLSGIRNNDVFLLDTDTRKVVNTITIDQSDMEDICNHLIMDDALCELKWDSQTFDNLKGVFPVLKRVYTTWDLDTDLTDGTTLLTDMVRKVFGNGEVEVYEL